MAKLTPAQESEAVDLLLELVRDHIVDQQDPAKLPYNYRSGYQQRSIAQGMRQRLLRDADDEQLAAARKIAATRSSQTGKNYANFINGDYDHAFGVQCALAGMAWALGGKL